MTKPCEIQTGIDTFSLYHTLTVQESAQLISELKKYPDYFYTEVSDGFLGKYRYTSHVLRENGIQIRIYKDESSPWAVTVIVHPSAVMGAKDLTQLFRAKKKQCRYLIEYLDDILSEVKFPYPVEHMTVNRVDVTANVVFDCPEAVTLYLKVLKKSKVLKKYKLEKFNKSSHSAEANRNSYKQSCDAASFFVYNKTKQLEQNQKIQIQEGYILRLEAQLRKNGMAKWITDRQESGIMCRLPQIWKKRFEILSWYWNRLQPVSCQYTTYSRAEQKIRKLSGEKMKHRMLYLIRKVSDCGNLSSALEKMQQELQLTPGKCETVIRKFKKLNINPITLPNDSKIEELESIGIYLSLGT